MRPVARDLRSRSVEHGIDPWVAVPTAFVALARGGPAAADGRARHKYPVKKVRGNDDDRKKAKALLRAKARLCARSLPLSVRYRT